MKLGGVFAGGLALIAGSAHAIQRAAIYPAPRAPVAPQATGGTLVEIPANGRVVFALHIPAEGDAPTCVHFHGNGEALADQATLAEAFGAEGLGFYAVEYPGYGLARRASPSEDAIYRDAEAALEHLTTTLGVSRNRIVLQGHSLGTGVAVEMARRGRGARVVLISPFTSMTDMIKRYAPILPRAAIVDDAFDSADKAPSIAVPVLIIHGTHDEIVPVDMGRMLSQRFPDALLYESPHGHHNDLFVVDGDDILRRIFDFARGKTQ